jgi:hypothetical protein
MDAIDLLAVDADVIGNEISGMRLVVTESVDCSGCTKPEVMGKGAGIYLFHCESIIQGNNISDCNIGIYSEISSGSINDNRIYGMSNEGCGGFCAYLNEDVVSSDSLAQMTGTGIVASGQTPSGLQVTGNEMTGNDNDGLFISDSKVILKDNIISDNAGYGIHTLDCQVYEAANNTLINNLAGYAYSIYVSFRTKDIYGDILPYANVEIIDDAGDKVYTASSKDMAFLSVILLSYVGDAPIATSAISSFKEYNFTFSKSGVVYHYSYTASPQQAGAHNISIPLLRSDLTVVNLKLDRTVVLGDEVEIKATIKNSGDAKATNVTVLFIWSLDGESRVIGSKTIPELDAGKSRSVSVLWAPQTKGDFSISVESDPDNEVKEISDGNNERRASTTVEADTGLWVMLSVEFILLLAIFLVVYIATNKKF